MKKTIALVTVLTVAMGLAACSPKAQNETAEAGNAVLSDVNATAAGAVDTVDAATDNAIDAPENSMDRMGTAADNAADKAARAAGTAADRMKAATGEAMTDTGNAMKAAGEDVKK